jgi:hypothetical protein
MTDATDEALQTAFNSVIAGRRGELSSFHADVARLIAQLMLTSRGMTDAGQLIAASSEISRLEQLLPPISADDGDGFDLRRLDDFELRELERLQCKCCDQTIPPWAIEQEPSTAPEISARAHGAALLADYVDERAERWRFGGCSADEANHLRNELSSLVSPLVCRHLWRDIFLGEAQGQIEDAVKRALKAAGSDAKVVPSTDAERRQIEPPALLDGPPEPTRTNGAGDLTAVWPFSPDKPP